MRRMAVDPAADVVEVALPGHEVLDELAAAVGDLAQDRHNLLGLLGLGRQFLLLGHLDSLSSTTRANCPSVSAPGPCRARTTLSVVVA